jgi:hypothetical protein
VVSYFSWGPGGMRPCLTSISAHLCPRYAFNELTGIPILTSWPTGNVHPSPPVCNVPARLLSAEPFGRLREGGRRRGLAVLTSGGTSSVSWRSKGKYTLFFCRKFEFTDENLRHLGCVRTGRRKVACACEIQVSCATARWLRTA